MCLFGALHQRTSALATLRLWTLPPRPCVSLFSEARLGGVSWAFGWGVVTQWLGWLDPRQPFPSYSKLAMGKKENTSQSGCMGPGVHPLFLKKRGLPEIFHGGSERNICS